MAAVIMEPSIVHCISANIADILNHKVSRLMFWRSAIFVKLFLTWPQLVIIIYLVV